MRVTIRYFSHLRSTLGCESESVEVADGAIVRDVVDNVAARHAAVANVRSSLRYAVGTSFVDAAHELSDLDELALLTPVSGG
ncbi:MAG: molybdopterin synthase sulfur carrier subunit [Bacteroidetes bacterium CG12_big_fil_rev_8_21_14_0_65_60_17]|nr:MAG: molybdopterin synthase sulfur carrier subunit [Bacteroidetes bacterium CG12_big_fil_rev_8_21_14_0_65_60_17]